MASAARPELSAYVGLGANLGQPEATLRWALQALGQVPGVRLAKASSLHRSSPVDATGPDFINAVAELATTLSAPALLQVLQALVEGRTEHLPHKTQLVQELNALLVHLAVAVARALIPHPGTERCPIRQHEV